MNINQVRLWNEFIAPYFIEELGSSQQLVATLHHVSEQLELARPQINLPVTTSCSSIEAIELQRSQ